MNKTNKFGTASQNLGAKTGKGFGKASAAVSIIGAALSARGIDLAAVAAAEKETR